MRLPGSLFSVPSFSFFSSFTPFFSSRLHSPPSFQYDPTIEDRYQKVIEHNEVRAITRPCSLLSSQALFARSLAFWKFWTLPARRLSPRFVSSICKMDKVSLWFIRSPIGPRSITSISCATKSSSSNRRYPRPSPF